MWLAIFVINLKYTAYQAYTANDAHYKLDDLHKITETDSNKWLMGSKNHKNLLFFILLPWDYNGRIKKVYSLILLMVRGIKYAWIVFRKCLNAEKKMYKLCVLKQYKL